MWVTTGIVIITSLDLIQDKKKNQILALHNKCNIIRTYYNLVLLESQVVWLEFTLYMPPNKVNVFPTSPSPLVYTVS